MDIGPSGIIDSVAAGGRYDNLVGKFFKGNTTITSVSGTSGYVAGDAADLDIPCVGVSFGIERLFLILKQKLKFRAFPIIVSVFI